MTGLELLEGDDPLAAPGQMIGRRAAHRAEPDHGDIVVRHGV